MRSRFFVVVLASMGAFGEDRAGLPVPAAGNVTLPLDEYNRLIEMASKPVKKPDAAPLAYSLKSADLKFQVAAECVSGTLQLEGEIFSKSATKVPLVSGLTIIDAQQKGKELPLQQEDGTHMAVLPGAAEFSITLKTGMAVTIEPGRASFNLVCRACSTARG